MDQAQEKRVEAISRCVDTIYEIRAQCDPLKSFEHNWNQIWGELDWLEELHRLVHEGES